MSTNYQENIGHGTARPRPRANTSFIAWRRNMPDASTSMSLASSPAAPVQTLPVDTLIQFLSPPAVPSPQHVRALVAAIRTQSPAPPPSVLTPILLSICSPDAPPLLQSAGYDALTAYCSCGAPLVTSDRITYFEILQSSIGAPWVQEVWEPRLKALRALVTSAEDVVGIEKKVLDVLSGWLKGALEEYCSSDVGRQEKERSIETLSDALLDWFSRFENAGRLSEGDVLRLFEFYHSLVESVLRLPPEVQSNSPPTPTPQTQRDSGVYRHKRHTSSLASIPSPLSPHSLNVRSTQLRGPLQFVPSIYLKFLNSRLMHLPSSFLPVVMPILCRISSAVMTPLPPLSPYKTKRNPVEQEAFMTISSLLAGPYASTSRILLRSSLSPVPGADLDTQIRTSLGAVRLLRLQIRHALEDRMAAREVQREASLYATHAGTSTSTDLLDADIVKRAQRAWNREGVVWDARKISSFFVNAIRSWVDNSISMDKERIFEEIACLSKDVLEEMDDRLKNTPEISAPRNNSMDESASRNSDDTDTGSAVGRTLYELMAYVQTLRNDDGSPVFLCLGYPAAAPSPFLRALAEVFSQKESLSFLDPPVSMILLHIVDHLYDADSERIPLLMVGQHHLKPTSPKWLENWVELLRSPSLFTKSRPKTRTAVVSTLNSVFALVRDMPAYRRPLVDRVFDFWAEVVKDKNEGAEGSTMWRLLGEEAMMRATEDDIEELFTPTTENTPELSRVTIHKILATMSAVSTYCDCNGEEESYRSGDAPPLSPNVPMTPSNTIASTAASPTLPRMASDGQFLVKDKESSSNMHQQFLSLLSFGSSKQQSQNQLSQVSNGEDALLSGPPRRSPSLRASPDPVVSPNVCRGLTAVAALSEVFQQLAFIDSAMSDRQSKLSIFVFGQLLRLLRTAQCPRSRIAVLQTLTRLRADRDHRVYLTRSPAEDEQQITSLARLISRAREGSDSSTPAEDAHTEETSLERGGAKQIFERDGRRRSRGRGSRKASGTTSRSTSRVPNRSAQQVFSSNMKPRDQIWSEPDNVPFSLENANKMSQKLITYDPTGPNEITVLPVSDYMDELVEIIKTSRDWEVLSYVLVHLPTQLANKHFWCGPLARESVANLLTELCQSIKAGTLGKYISQEEWPSFSRSRAVGLAYHTLTVLISYHSIFDPARRMELIDVLRMGLSGVGDTVVVCMHALNLCAYEMESTMVKELQSILEQLTQIVSNPVIAVHILTFLGNLNSLPTIYSNFTDHNFKLVFAVALQYLQHHNRLETSREMPFSLSQHVRIMSYYVLYLWFLTLKLEDRPRHVPYIVRQLLLANDGEGQSGIDAPTEVAFDLLARYTYANADPKPAPSLLGDILSKPAEESSSSESIQEKSWIVGYSIVTVRLLAKAGWLEVVTRRPSGTTKFLGRAENVPLVDLGDVNPDMFTIPASLMMNKDPALLREIRAGGSDAHEPDVSEGSSHPNGDNELFSPAQEGESAPRPDPVTGYVWSASAPSQRRKQVNLDPSYFPLQLSRYPEATGRPYGGWVVIRDSRALASTIRTLDRTPVIDTHKVGILYVAPGQTNEKEILKNVRGSPAYTRFLEGIGRLIRINGQLDVYTGGLDASEDGEFAYAWWDDTAQILYHTATMMPNHEHDENGNLKKRHIGNDLVRIIWNDSGHPYQFDTLKTEFQFVNIVIEPHSQGAIAAYSNNFHENEYFKLTVQLAEGMAEFAPIGNYKIISARMLSIFVRQLSIVADWYASIFKDTNRDTERNEFVTNWRYRLETIKKLSSAVPNPSQDTPSEPQQGVMGLESFLDFTPGY